MKQRDLSRRDVVKLGGGTIVVVAAGALGIKVATGGGDGGSGGVAATAGDGAKEAPARAALVKQGKLPPLAERLPPKPVVIQPVKSVGKYGGTWHTLGVGAEDAGSWMVQTVYYDGVLRWDPLFKGSGSITDVQPNLAESIDYNKAGTEYVFKLRQGIKWSDGKPFTADDVVFAVNDIMVNEVLAPAPSSRFVGNDGQRCKATKVDEYTVKITYPTPNSLMLQGMCSAAGFQLAAPKHYLERFHGDYTKGLGKNWAEDFVAKNNMFANVERPTVTPWMVTTPLGESSQAVFQRNPYYWKVDPDGRQLPYIDEVVFAIASDPEVALAQALNGQVDLHSRTINTTRNKPVLADSRKKGNYDFFDVKTGFMNSGLIMFNQTSEDKVKREIFSNRDFRIGLSYAINRQEIIESVYAGQGKPLQAAPRPNSPWHDEQMATQYTEYDVAKANQSLDKAGYPMRGGARVGPNGKPISFVVITASVHPDTAQALDFVKRSWKAVGVDMKVQNVDETLFFERVTAGKHDAACYQGVGGDNPVLYPGQFIPTASRSSNWAPQWGLWFESHGEAGEEPPAKVKAWLDTYTKIQGTTDDTQQHDLMVEILSGVRDEFTHMGLVLPPDGYGIVKNTFHNVPDPIQGDLTYPNLAPSHPEQYFVD
jgi:peptide/nickel transport system substrate-binding protein